MTHRIIKDEIVKSAKSVLILGPRQVGKSTLISEIKVDLKINLADEFEFLKFSSDPNELKNLISLNKPQKIFVDEIQRIPSLLNTIQYLIDENKKLKFYLTGSSARKLRRGNANLLPGRIFNFQLGPLIASELNSDFNIKKALSVGLLPEVYLNKVSSQSIQLLKSYTALYLKEEIKAEALVRNLESFARFLTEVVQSVSQFVDFTKLAQKAKISRHAVPRYFEILEDTMIGYRVHPCPALMDDYDLIKHPRFYFFDTGVYNALQGNFEPSLDRIGVLAEQLVFNQLMHSAWAYSEDIQINTFRTRSGQEVDFIIKLKNKLIGIEVKSSDHFSSSEIETLISLKNKKLIQQGFVFHTKTKEEKIGPIWSLPLQKGLKELGL
ncbi:MAG: ATP-binding protein [Bdellovibrio sp.]|nr:ATP-binding protein [Bdellovibrio sp.]